MDFFFFLKKDFYRIQVVLQETIDAFWSQVRQNRATWWVSPLFVSAQVSQRIYKSVDVSFFMLRRWAKLEAATGSSTGWNVLWFSAEYVAAMAP